MSPNKREPILEEDNSLSADALILKYDMAKYEPGETRTLKMDSKKIRTRKIKCKKHHV